MNTRFFDPYYGTIFVLSNLWKGGRFVALDVKRREGRAFFLALGISNLLIATMLFVQPSGFMWFLFAYSLITIIYYLTTLSKKPPEVVLHDDYLELNGKRWNPEEVGSIYIRGYFTTYIAIVPEGRRLAPIDHCFRLGTQDLRDMKALREWAERNAVKVETKKRIKTLI